VETRRPAGDKRGLSRADLLERRGLVRMDPGGAVSPAQDMTEANVAIDTRGNALAIWARREGSNASDAHSVVLASYRAAGADRWQAPKKLGTSDYGADQPMVAFDGAGNATVAWSHEDELESSTRSAATGAWTKPLVVAPQNDDRYRQAGALGVDYRGDAVLAWRGSEGAYEISYRPAPGSRWDPPSRPLPVSWFPSLAVASDGSIILAGFDDDNVLKVVTGFRGRWQEPVSLGASTDPWFGAAVAIAPGGDTLVAWTTTEHGNDIVYASARIRGAWEERRRLSFIDGQAEKPEVAIDGRGDMLAVWRAETDEESSYRPAGGDWQWPVAISPQVFLPFWPHLVMNEAGQAAATWGWSEDVSIAKTNWPAAAAYFTPTGGWAPAERLETDTFGPTREVAIDPAGDAVAIWGRDEGRGGSLQSAALDAGGPYLHAVFNQTGPVIQGNARPGRTLVCRKGTWMGDEPISYRTRWLRGRQIVAASSTYRVTRSDEGRKVSCEVRATNSFGSVKASSPPVTVKRRAKP
jgi:hypothetical protein